MRKLDTEEQLNVVRAEPVEFQTAVDYLADKPDNAEFSQGAQAYIKIEGQVVQIADISLGSGSYTRAQVAYNQAGDRFAIKFSSDANQHLSDEERIERELGAFRGAGKRTVTRADGSTYIEHIRLMPYLGKNLAKYMTLARFSSRSVLNIILQCLQEVLDLHAKGYFHRDIKPNNYVFDRFREKVNLIDFGYAVRIPPSGIFSCSEVLGTEGYKAPEVSEGIYSAETEIFALGVSILEIIDLFGVDLPAIRSLAKMMSSRNPERRPDLELVKMALIVYQNRDLSLEQLAKIVNKNHYSIDPELAVRKAVILLNATKENAFSDPENFKNLVYNPKIQYVVSIIWQRPKLRKLIFSALNTVQRIDELFYAFKQLEKAGKLSDETVFAVFNYPDFGKLLSLEKGEFFDANELLVELAKQGKLALMQEVMANPAVICDYFRLGQTLAWAISRGRWKMAATLILAGSPSNETPLVFLELVKVGALDLVEPLVNFDRDLLNQIDNRFSDKTALMEAASRGQHDVLQCLIALGADLNQCDRKGDTALFHALDQDQWDSAKMLLKAAANPSIKNLYGYSPLRICLAKNNFAMIAYLLLYDADLDVISCDTFKKHKSEILMAIQNLLGSDEMNTPEEKERVLRLLRRMGTPLCPETEEALRTALFGGCCLGLFKSAARAEMEGLFHKLSAGNEDFVAVQPVAT